MQLELPSEVEACLRPNSFGNLAAAESRSITAPVNSPKTSAPSPNSTRSDRRLRYRSVAVIDLVGVVLRREIEEELQYLQEVLVGE